MSKGLRLDFNESNRTLLDKLNAYSDYIHFFVNWDVGKNPGIVARLLKNVSLYRDIGVESLNFNDLHVLYNLINADLEDKIINEEGLLELRKGKNWDNFTFNQYCFLKEYVEEILGGGVDKQFV